MLISSATLAASHYEIVAKMSLQFQRDMKKKLWTIKDHIQLS